MTAALKHILLFWGASANELSRAELELLTPQISTQTDDHPSFTVSQYSSTSGIFRS
jgi:hypothetical protein